MRKSGTRLIEKLGEGTRGKGKDSGKLSRKGRESL